MELSDWSLEWNLPGQELENETFSKKTSFACSANDKRRTGIFVWNRPIRPAIHPHTDAAVGCTHGLR